MSRHTLNGMNNTIVVLGFDRPLCEYFAQVWDANDEELLQSIDMMDPEEDLEELLPVIPDGLLDQLRKEALGEADTNTIKDWR